MCTLFRGREAATLGEHVRAQAHVMCARQLILSARASYSQQPAFNTPAQMVQYSLQGDYTEAEVAPAAKLLQVVLQVCFFVLRSHSCLLSTACMLAWQLFLSRRL